MSSSELNIEFESLLNYIKRNRGFDFTGYKRSTLMRRVQKRLQSIKIESYRDYVDHLEVHPEEFIHLFNTILINVTSFFRDSSAWDYLSSEIIPQIAASKRPNEPIRIWCAGCASGQEAYTLAIILSEAVGVEQFSDRVKIYATDLDGEALNQARHGTYSVKEVAEVPTHFLEQYFDLSEQGYTFRKGLRRSVIFGRHNLVVDAPISRVDLLVCRNTLMYFNAEAQTKIIGRFHFALNEGSFLFLGKAEMLLTHTNSFMPVDLKRRIFSKVLIGRDRLLLMPQNNNDEPGEHLASHVRLRDAALDVSPVAQVVVDLKGALTLANERARSLFGLNSNDLNRPLQDLELSYRPVELRSCIEQAYEQRVSLTLTDIEWTITAGNTKYFNVQVSPLKFSGNLLGVSISFTDVSRSNRLQDELDHSNQELEMAYEVLQSTNEELETTNEELQSSNEELKTTNEELQATNEELETMNEELQSSNEELSLRSAELNEVNDFLESIFTGLRSGVVVVNRDLQIQVWNDRSEELWGLRAEEVLNRHFMNLDIGLPVEQLRQQLRSCITGESNYLEVTLVSTNRRGRQIQCKITCTPLVGTGEIRGVILLMEEDPDFEQNPTTIM